MKYRSELPFGEGYRDFVEVCTHETYELGNGDILDGLKDGLLQHSYLYGKLRQFFEEYQLNGFINDMSETDWKQFFIECKEELARIYNIQPDYVLWLADSYNAVKQYDLHDEVNPDNVDCYEESEYVITDLGFDGALYIYEMLPEPICALAELQQLNAEPELELE